MNKVNYCAFFLLVALMQGCAVTQVPTIPGQAHAALLEAESFVISTARSLKDYRDAGIIVKGSSDDERFKKALTSASTALDKAWAAFNLQDFTDALSGAKTAKQLYFALRQDLLKIGGVK